MNASDVESCAMLAVMWLGGFSGVGVCWALGRWLDARQAIEDLDVW